MCWGEGERETQEVSLAVKNSPYAIWANRCKAECNKIQVWEITPRVWGGKIISAAFFMFSVSLDFFYFLFLVCIFACYRADPSPMCTLTSFSLFFSTLSLCSASWEWLMLKIKNSVSAVSSAINVSYAGNQRRRDRS